jgi:hypothetical protein
MIMKPQAFDSFASPEAELRFVAHSVLGDRVTYYSKTSRETVLRLSK